MLRRMVARFWWIPVGVLAVCTALTVIDVRFLFVTLIVVFNVVPFAVFNIYFYRLLTPGAQQRLCPRRVEFAPGSHIRVEYVEEEREIEGRETEEMEDSGQKPLPSPDLYKWADVRRAYFSGRFLVIELSDCTLLLVPSDALPQGFSLAAFPRPDFVYDDSRES